MINTRWYIRSDCFSTPRRAWPRLARRSRKGTLLAGPNLSRWTRTCCAGWCGWCYGAHLWPARGTTHGGSGGVERGVEVGGGGGGVQYSSPPISLQSRPDYAQNIRISISLCAVTTCTTHRKPAPPPTPSARSASPPRPALCALYPTKLIKQSPSCAAFNLPEYSVSYTRHARTSPT